MPGPCPGMPPFLSVEILLLSRPHSDTPVPGRLSWAPQLDGPFPCLVLLSLIASSSERDPGPCLLLKPREDKWIASEGTEKASPN